MKKVSGLSLLFATVVTLLLALPAPASAAVRIYVNAAPPPLVVETRPVSPGARYVWVGGFHRWDGRAYVWVPGRWALPPRARARWVAGHWAHHRRGWYWIEGRWR